MLNEKVSGRPAIEFIVTDDRVRTFGTPSYGTAGSAGADLRGLLPDDRESLVIAPGGQVTLDTGIRMHIKDRNVAGVILPRSGLGVKGLVIGNLVGLIDSDYQGPLKLCLWNRSDRSIEIRDGDRLAQLVLIPVIHAPIVEVAEFDAVTDRGNGGFGSTGVSA